jgi:predicted NAD/FAD-binding protein
MNNLQRLRSREHYFVTLNRTERIDPAKTIRRIAYDHPVYTKEGVAAQARWAEISKAECRTHFCGAYWGWGFHEDGVVSALRAVAAIDRDRDVVSTLDPAITRKRVETMEGTLAA